MIRKLLLVLGILLLALLAVRTVWWEPASLQLREECLNVGWTAQRPLRVAVLTDLHVGSPFNGLDKLRDVVARTNEARPDLVCILGDLVINGVKGGSFVTPEDIARELGRLQAPAGVFAVLGNHDAWFNATRVEQALVNARIEVLQDRAVRLPPAFGGIWVAGVSDFWTGRHDVNGALSGITDTTSPLVVITHNPDVFPEIPARVSLTIAGHTHGGQVRLPFIGPLVVPSRYGQRFAGGHIVENGRHLYVATGIGTSILPFRLGVPPAINVLGVGSKCAL